MNLRFEWSVGIKFLLSRKKSRTLSLNTIISIGGVTIGVAALIATLAIMTGFKEDVREKILGANSHIVVMGMSDDGIADYMNVTAAVKEMPEVIGAAPFIYRQVLLSYNNKSVGVVMRGIVPRLTDETTDLSKNMVLGSLDDLLPAAGEEGRESGHSIIIGKEIAFRLGTFVGDKIKVLSPEGDLTPLGLIPKMRKYVVVGIFETGMYEYDSGMVYVSLADSQAFFNMESRVSGVEVKVKNIYEAGRIAQEIEQKLNGNFLARDWQKLNKNLFSALELEKAMMFIILILIILVASFNILGTLSMMIIEKSKEIGILKTMGAANSSIMRILMVEGAFIGLTGTAIGMPLGISICYILQKFYSLPGDVYYIDHLPVRLNISDITLVSVSAILISLLATFYPAIQASKSNPSEVLRYE